MAICVTGKEAALQRVVIVGRPNVGKSTLFNRIVGRRVAIVEEQPGVTRDRLATATDWGRRRFVVVDTGGLDPGKKNGLAGAVLRQVEFALKEADVILLVVDGSLPLTANDWEAAERVRLTGKKVVLVANKVDSPKQQIELGPLYKLGLGDPVLVSAAHGYNIDELLEKVVALVPAGEPGEAEEPAVRVAVLGRPNVGKSSFLNALLREERLIVHEEPGTTRDAVEVELAHAKGRILLVDTAGMRRRSKVGTFLEKLSLERAGRSIERCQVAILVIDGEAGVTGQDARLAAAISDAGKGCVILITKWDLAVKHLDRRTATAEKKLQRDYASVVLRRMPMMSYAPVHCSSSLTGRGVEKAVELVLRVADEWRRCLSQELMEHIRRSIISGVQPPVRGRSSLRVYGLEQVRAGPPTFLLQVNEPASVSEEYKRYVAGRIRALAGLEGTPIRFVVRRQRHRDAHRSRGKD